MYRKKLSSISVILAIILMLAYAILSYYYTFYGLGIFAIPFVCLFSLFLTYLGILLRRKWRKAFWLIFSLCNSVFFIGLLLMIAIDNYKPNFYIYVPEDYQGMIHLLPAKEAVEELWIDQYGIGYFKAAGEVEVIVKQGNRNITNALNHYGRRNLRFNLPDSLHFRVIDISCFEVAEGRVYGNSPWNQSHVSCMDEMQFIEMWRAGIIDSSKLRQNTYPRLLPE